MSGSGSFAVGNFKGPATNSPRAESPAKIEIGTKTASEEPEKSDVPEVSNEKTPVELYKERLEKEKMKLTDALAIYDSVLMNGYYEEVVQIRKSRAVFRTRSYADTVRLHEAMEVHNPRTQAAYDDLVARHNLAASLCEWNGKIIPHTNANDADLAMSYVRELPMPIWVILSDALAKFDKKIYLVFSEGATDAF